MNINRLLSTTAVVTSLAFASAAYAQQTPPAPQAAPSAPAAAAAEAMKAPPAGAPKSRDALIRLSPEKTKLLHETMKDAFEKNKDLREKIQRMQEEANGILTAEKFDKKAYLAKNIELDKLRDQYRQNMSEALASVAEQYNKDERVLLTKLHSEPHGEAGQSAMQNEKGPSHPLPAKQ